MKETNSQMALFAARELGWKTRDLPNAEAWQVIRRAFRSLPLPGDLLTQLRDIAWKSRKLEIEKRDGPKPPKKPRGRPRKDGLVTGAPDAPRRRPLKPPAGTT